jgi:hypothetical protein
MNTGEENERREHDEDLRRRHSEGFFQSEPINKPVKPSPVSDYDGPVPAPEVAVKKERKGILMQVRTIEMLNAAKPLMKWLSDNCHPHCTAHVQQNMVELVESVALEITDEFIKD